MPTLDITLGVWALAPLASLQLFNREAHSWLILKSHHTACCPNPMPHAAGIVPGLPGLQLIH